MDTVFKLEDLVLDEVSLVDKAANEGARIVFAKRDTSRVDSDEFIYRRASVKGDPPASEKEKVQMQKSEQHASIKKALTGELNKNQIDELITTLVGKHDTDKSQRIAEAKFLETPVGQALHTAYDKAKPMAPLAVVAKSAELPINKADALVHRLAMAHQKASKGRLTYAQSYSQALKDNPHLAPKAIDNQEPDEADVSKVDAELVELAKLAAA